MIVGMSVLLGQAIGLLHVYKDTGALDKGAVTDFLKLYDQWINKTQTMDDGPIFVPDKDKAKDIFGQTRGQL